LSYEAFLRLYDRCAQDSLVFLARRVCDAEAAADLWAQVWAVLYERRHRFRGSTPAEAEAWLYTLARHALADYYRTGKIAHRANQRLAGQRPVATPDDLERIEELCSLNSLRGLIAAALIELPAQQREAVRLRIVEERDYADVARGLGCSEQTARMRVSRGLRALKDKLEPTSANPKEAVA
jgi:RNA polymerase sigma factor (sigma-70 family)